MELIDEKKSGSANTRFSISKLLMLVFGSYPQSAAAALASEVAKVLTKKNNLAKS